MKRKSDAIHPSISQIFGALFHILTYQESTVTFCRLVSVQEVVVAVAAFRDIQLQTPASLPRHQAIMVFNIKSESLEKAVPMM